jgi:uncharacterized membrane protein YkoI
LISKYQGETLEYEVEVKNADGTAADLTGCAAIAGLSNGSTVTRLTPDITGNVLSIKLTPAETALMQGTYSLEIKIKDTGSDVEVVSRELIQINKSIIPEFTPTV